MKKILVLMLSIAACTSISFAQQHPNAHASNRAKYVTATNHGATKRTYPVQHRKADGTFDRRYKSNQTHVFNPLKKDGTKDMRYNSNKGKKN